MSTREHTRAVFLALGITLLALGSAGVGCSGPKDEAVTTPGGGTRTPAKPITLEQRKQEIQNNATMPPQAKQAMLQQMREAELRAPHTPATIK